jgi:hypothetical protein
MPVYLPTGLLQRAGPAGGLFQPPWPVAFLRAGHGWLVPNHLAGVCADPSGLFRIPWLALCAGLGERGVPAEAIGAKAASELMDVIASGACTDEWLQVSGCSAGNGSAPVLAVRA